MLSQHGSKRLLIAGATCWRREHARRIAILVDGAAYFHAMKAAMRAARHSILLLGWDFDPHVPLEGDRQEAIDRTVCLICLRAFWLWIGVE